MYINTITYKDTTILLDRNDYDLLGCLLLESGNKVIKRLDSVFDGAPRNIELESYDLEPDRFVNFIKLKYRYTGISVFYCNGWLLDEI